MATTILFNRIRNTAAVAQTSAPVPSATTPLGTAAATLSRRRKSLGQGMTEYIVIVALVGVAAIGVYSFLGGSVRGATAGIALEISGQNAQRGITAAQNAANNAVTNAARRTTLGNYNEGNR